jgi:hypothetical protein
MSSSKKIAGESSLNHVCISIGDPEPETDPDPHVLGPSGSGTIYQWSRVRLWIPPCSHKGNERTEIMLAKNKILTQNFSKKLNF